MLVVAVVGAVFAIWHDEIGTVASIKMLRERNDDHNDGAVYAMQVRGTFTLTTLWRRAASATTPT